jgi:cell division septal protein FtsQ
MSSYKIMQGPKTEGSQSQHTHQVGGGDIPALNDLHPEFDAPDGTTTEVNIHSVKHKAGDESDKLRDLASRIKLFAMFLLILMLYLTHDALTTLEPFQLRQVMFHGQARVTPQDLYHKLQLEQVRPSIVSPHLDQIEESLRDHPWIKDADASFDYWSGIIHVDVIEYQPKGVVVLNELMAVTADGVPFATIQPRDAEGLPLISGLSPDLFNTSPQDKLIGRYWISRAIELAHHIKSSKLLEHRKLSEIHISPTGRYEVLLDHIRVVLGSDMLRERILEVERILEHLSQKQVSAAYILLSDDLNRAIVKETPLSATDTESNNPSVP